MARKPIINPDELLESTACRIQLTSWEKYQKQLEHEDSRTYVMMTIFRTMDSIRKGTPNERLLWWELIRLSGAGRRKGWVVIGDNEPITPADLSSILNLDVKVVIDGLRENMKQRRITCNSA